MTELRDNITDDRRQALDGFSQLTDLFFDVPQMPMPKGMSHAVIAEDDATGTAEVARLARICVRNEVPYRDSSTDYKNAIEISYNGITYEIFYIYRHIMRVYQAEMSYVDNLRVSYIDLEDE